MKVPFGWKLPLVAVIATGVALWGGGAIAISIPAAAVAVGAAVLLLVEAWGLPPPRPPVSRGSSGANPRGAIRDSFRLGRVGREQILEELDRLERTGPNPALPGRVSEEFDRIARLTRDEFREYVRARLDDLEVRT